MNFSKKMHLVNINYFKFQQNKIIEIKLIFFSAKSIHFHLIIFMPHEIIDFKSDKQIFVV